MALHVALSWETSVPPHFYTHVTWLHKAESLEDEKIIRYVKLI